MSGALDDVAQERARQVAAYAFDSEHDDDHDAGELAGAGAAYALNAADQLHPQSQGDGHNQQPLCWPWEGKWWRPKEPRRDLVRAAALIVAEIDRLDRAAASTQSIPEPQPTMPSNQNLEQLQQAAAKWNALVSSIIISPIGEDHEDGGVNWHIDIRLHNEETNFYDAIAAAAARP